MIGTYSTVTIVRIMYIRLMFCSTLFEVNSLTDIKVPTEIAFEKIYQIDTVTCEMSIINPLIHVILTKSKRLTRIYESLSAINTLCTGK